jgi:DNA repair protein RadC
MKYKISEPITDIKKWKHPGGKLLEKGAESLTDAELLAIIISTGTKGKTAEQLADEILKRFSGYRGIANQPLERFLQFKGMGERKIIRIAALFEIARRIVDQVFEEYEKD